MPIEVSEMTRDQLEPRHVGLQVLGRRQRHVLMARAVEAVAAHALVQVQLVRHRVGVSVRRQLRVKRRVEHRDVWHRRKHLACRTNAGEVGRVVQRREHGTLGDDLLDVVVDARGGDQALAAVHDAMTDRADRARVGYRSSGSRQVREDRAEGRGNRAAVDRVRTGLVDVLRLRRAHALDAADREARLGVHVVEVVLDGRGPDVDDEDLHHRPW